MSTSLAQLDPEELKRNLALTLGTRAPQLANLNEPQMAAPPPSAPPMPDKRYDLGLTSPQPAVKAPRGTVEGDQAERSRQLDTGAGVDQISSRIKGSSFGQNHPKIASVLGPLAQGAGKVGSLAIQMATPFGPMIPGTEEHHLTGLRQLNSQIGSEESEQEKEAQTRNLDTQPELKQAQIDVQQGKVDESIRQHDQQLREHGFKVGPDGNISPLTYDEMSPQQQAVNDLKSAQEEEKEASAALKKAQADPNSFQARQAQQRIDNARQTRAIAMERLGLSEATFSARYHGTDTHGNALPGAMITEDGQPVGSSFSQNVRPTGQERNKGDMANSAAQQIADMKNIIAKRPDIFGPAAGRTTEFSVWAGSQDPDAQRFRAARTIAGDHLAGTFGGRSEAALQALDNAIGQFKDNPQAALAGLDQLAGATTTFQKAGTVKTAGSKASAPAPSGPAPSFTVKLTDAMALPQNKGKSAADVKADVAKHGGRVVE